MQGRVEQLPKQEPHGMHGKTPDRRLASHPWLAASQQQHAKHILLQQFHFWPHIASRLAPNLKEAMTQLAALTAQSELQLRALLHSLTGTGACVLHLGHPSSCRSRHHDTCNPTPQLRQHCCAVLIPCPCHAPCLCHVHVHGQQLHHSTTKQQQQYAREH